MSENKETPAKKTTTTQATKTTTTPTPAHKVENKPTEKPEVKEEKPVETPEVKATEETKPTEKPVEKMIDETFEKATEETNKKLEESSKEKEDESNESEEKPEENEQNSEYSLITSNEGDAHLAIESIVEEEKLDLSKDSVQLAMKKDEDTIYYRIKKDSGEYSEWKIYAKIEKVEPQEGDDLEIERILSEEHYFSFSSAGRHILNGDYDEEKLKAFYEEFKSSDILFNKNHYDLLDLLKAKFD